MADEEITANTNGQENENEGISKTSIAESQDSPDITIPANDTADVSADEEKLKLSSIDSVQPTGETMKSQSPDPLSISPNSLEGTSKTHDVSDDKIPTIQNTEGYLSPSGQSKLILSHSPDASNSRSDSPSNHSLPIHFTPDSPSNRNIPIPPPISPTLGISPSIKKQSSSAMSSCKSSHASERIANSSTALNMVWSFGWNRDIPVFNLCDGERSCVLYICAHVAVIYNFVNNTQTLLQGHANAIVCMSLSADKKWLATADLGKNCTVIVWDTYTSIPVQTIFDPDNDGVVAMAMTTNSRYLATLSCGPIQVLTIWDWTLSDNTPLCTAELMEEYGLQVEIIFNPENENQLMSNSETQVIFYFWDRGHVEYFTPPLSDHDFHKPVGRFSQSIFHQGTSRALTATSIGNIVVWSENTLSKDVTCVADKKALKIIKVMDCGIRVLTTVDSYIALGMANGLVKFYDQDLKLVNWYSELNFGSISSISFDSDSSVSDSAGSGTEYPFQTTIERPLFVVRNFVVSTLSSVIAHITTNGSIAKVIHREHDAEIHALATHPSKPLVTVGSHASLLKVWDYKKKQSVCSRLFPNNAKLSCCAYNNDGSVLGVGTTDGRLFLLDPVSLADLIEEPFHYARDVITHIKFCHNSKFMATADAEYTTSLYKRTSNKPYSDYIYLARYRAHYKPIRDIMFGLNLDSSAPRLLSLGEDRLLVEYDLENSCVGELKLLTTDRIEQSALPMCMTWYPPVTKEHFILTSNDQYKFKMYNATTKMCRKTLLGPTYGSPVLKMKMIPNEHTNKERFYMAFHTNEKVGIHMMPLDGNPNNAMSVVAHPVGVTNMVCGYEGQYMFTSGGVDESLHMWSINVWALEAQSNLGGEDLIPFYGLLEGGREGDMFADMEDYFYYALIRSQGVNANTMRQTSVTIPLYQVPSVMRAMGFYPTEQEIENMTNEVKFSQYVDTGKFVDQIDLGIFIKLYINHRPAFGLSLQQLFDAFETLGVPSDDGMLMERAELLELLQSKGEHMTVYELAEYLTTLLGYNAEGGVSEGHVYDPTYAGNIIDEHLPYQVSADMFSQEILGFPISKHL